MATTVKLSLAYCSQCMIGLGWGANLLAERTGHFVKGTFHPGSLVEIDSTEAIAQGEAYDAFLARMVAKYVTKK